MTTMTPTKQPATAPTKQPTRTTTPVPAIVVVMPKVVVPTVLVGFWVKTFTRGIRHAYTRAFMRRFSITDARRVIITNIRMHARGGAARRLDDVQQRVLAAASGVAFDIEVSTNTTTEAEAFKPRSRGATRPRMLPFSPISRPRLSSWQPAESTRM